MYIVIRIFHKYYNCMNKTLTINNREYSKTINNTEKRLTKKTAVVIGYGGASRAVVYALKKESFEEIKVLNRTENKIHHLNTQLLKLFHPKM